MSKLGIWGHRESSFNAAFMKEELPKEKPTLEEIKEGLFTVNNVYEHDSKDNFWVNLSKIPLEPESHNNNTEKYRFSYIDKFNELSNAYILNGEHSVEYFNPKLTDVDEWLSEYQGFYDKLRESFHHITYLGKLPMGGDALGVTRYKYSGNIDDNRVYKFMSKDKKLQEELEETARYIHQWASQIMNAKTEVNTVLEIGQHKDNTNNKNIHEFNSIHEYIRFLTGKLKEAESYIPHTENYNRTTDDYILNIKGDTLLEYHDRWMFPDLGGNWYEKRVNYVKGIISEELGVPDSEVSHESESRGTDFKTDEGYISKDLDYHICFYDGQHETLVCKIPARYLKHMSDSDLHQSVVKDINNHKNDSSWEFK